MQFKVINLKFATQTRALKFLNDFLGAVLASLDLNKSESKIWIKVCLS